jgi:hypothetical protein
MIKRTEPPPWEREKPRLTEPKGESSSHPDSSTIAYYQETPPLSLPARSSSSPPSRPVVGRPAEEINNYALWCIQHGMWKEARTHLEKAATTDSMTASLQNNLGLVYEYLNLDEKADVAYQRATALNPDQGIYRENYRRFRRATHTERKAREEAKTLPDTVKAVTDTTSLR